MSIYTATTKSIETLIEEQSKEFNLGAYSFNAISEALLKAQASMAKSFGATQKEIFGLRKEISVAAPEVVRLGGTLDDVTKLQEGVADGLGTNTILLGETTAQLFAAGKVFGKTSTEIGKTVADFEKIGISAGVVGDKLNIAANQARRIGANTSAVYTQISQNLDNLNKYGFQNGIEGLTRMAAKATALRIDMRDISYFAEKVYTPEGAIETVAALQRMGAAVGDLADPFRLMYMAQEDMEGLLNSVTKMSDKFAYFDEQSKEFKIFPNAKRDLREISQALGINQSTLNDMIIGQAKLQKMGGEIRLQNITDEDRLLISSLATMDKTTGKYQVKVEGVTKMVSELNSKDLEALQREPKTLEDLAREQLTAQQTLVALYSSQSMMFRSLELGGKIPDQLAQTLKGVTNTMSDLGKITTNPRSIRGGIDNTDLVLSQAVNLLSQVAKGTISSNEINDKIKNIFIQQETLFKNLITKVEVFDFKTQFSGYISSNNTVVNTLGLAATKLDSLINDIHTGVVQPLKDEIEKAKRPKTIEDVKNMIPTGQQTGQPTGQPIGQQTGISSYQQNLALTPTDKENSQNLITTLASIQSGIQTLGQSKLQNEQNLVPAFPGKDNSQNLTTTLTSNNIEQRNTQLFSGTQNTINQNQNNPVLSTISYLANIDRKPPEVETRLTDINVNNKNEVNGQIALVLSYNGNEIKIDDMTVNQIIKNPEFISYVKGQINDSKPKSQFDAVPNYAQS